MRQLNVLAKKYLKKSGFKGIIGEIFTGFIEIGK
jgi:hypothetical protein